jgi:adenylate cyclase
MTAMTEDVKMKRRLTTVLCADVHGYTRLMERDEAGTLATLRRYRTAMASLVERHDGRIVNTWGDAVIAEFGSVVEAVQCAIETQQELSHQDRDLPDAQRMRFRIGINLGDVMVDGSDIYGEGVNIAARLQELAEPGGIMISGPVYDQVHNKLSVGFDFLGRQQVKNVAAPVTSYRVSVNGTGGGQARPEADEQAARAFGASDDLRRPQEPAGATQAVLDWFAGLPRPVATVVVVSIFLFLIDILTGSSIWFHWPVLGMGLFLALRAVLRHNPERDGKNRRRPDGE